MDSDNDRIDLSEDEDLWEASRYSRMKGFSTLDVKVETRQQVSDEKPESASQELNNIVSKE